MEVVGFARQDNHLYIRVRVTLFVVVLFAKVLHADAACHVHSVQQEVFAWLVLIKWRSRSLVQKALVKLVRLNFLVLRSDCLVSVIHVAKLIERAKGDDVEVCLELCRTLSRFRFVLQVTIKNWNSTYAEKDQNRHQSKRTHIQKNYHVDHQFDQRRGVNLALIVWIFTCQHAPGYYRQYDVTQLQ